MCKDGSSPQPPKQKGDDCEEGLNVQMIVLVSVAGSLALLCMGGVTYCWCRSARKAPSSPKVSQQPHTTSAVCVVGVPVAMDNDNYGKAGSKVGV